MLHSKTGSSQILDSYKEETLRVRHRHDNAERCVKIQWQPVLKNVPYLYKLDLILLN